MFSAGAGIFPSPRIPDQPLVSSQPPLQQTRKGGERHRRDLSPSLLPKIRMRGVILPLPHISLTLIVLMWRIG